MGRTRKRLTVHAPQAEMEGRTEKMKTREQFLFEDAPVSRAVVSLVIPTVISQLITVVYNMADTFFIGQIGDPNQVAAVSLCMPMFVFLTGLANLFGIGGSSLLSRCLGAGDHGKGEADGGLLYLDIRGGIAGLRAPDSLGAAGSASSCGGE